MPTIAPSSVGRGIPGGVVVRSVRAPSPSGASTSITTVPVADGRMYRWARPSVVIVSR